MSRARLSPFFSFSAVDNLDWTRDSLRYCGQAALLDELQHSEGGADSFGNVKGNAPLAPNGGSPAQPPSGRSYVLKKNGVSLAKGIIYGRVGVRAASSSSSGARDWGLCVSDETVEEWRFDASERWRTSGGSIVRVLAERCHFSL